MVYEIVFQYEYDTLKVDDDDVWWYIIFTGTTMCQYLVPLGKQEDLLHDVICWEGASAN